MSVFGSSNVTRGADGWDTAVMQFVKDADRLGFSVNRVE